MRESVGRAEGASRIAMTDWVDLFETASRAMCENNERSGFLVYPSNGKRSRIREPEARHVMTLSLRERAIRYGVEVPTKNRYIISGKKPDTANADLVIDPDRMHIGVEFKCGQPEIPSIVKDVKKFRGEAYGGAAFFHTLQSSNSKTLPSLLDKYRLALTTPGLPPETETKELLLWILVKEKKRCYWKVLDTITDIDGASFKLGGFSRAQF